MTTFPGSPRVLRGALVSVDVVTLSPTVIPFQYNPGTLTRSFALGGSGDGPDAGQRSSPPQETIQVELELDATDDLAKGKGPDAVSGRIAAILGLVAPRSADIVSNLALVAQGSIEILPPDAPVILFVFGPKRVLPVHLTEISVTEEAHDPDLNAIRARITVGMAVIRYADLSQGHPAHALSIANQVAREASARTVTGTGLSANLGADLDVL